MRRSMIFETILMVGLVGLCTCQLPNLIMNTNGIPPNVPPGNGGIPSCDPNNLGGLGGSSVIQQQIDIPIIDSDFKNCCMDLVSVTATTGATAELIDGFKANVCTGIVSGIGNALQNQYLGKKMINYMAKELVSTSFSYASGLATSIPITVSMNANIIKSLMDNKETCWSDTDNCKLTQAVLAHSKVQQKWKGIRDFGQTKVKEIVESITGGGRRRMLALAKDIVESSTQSSKSSSSNGACSNPERGCHMTIIVDEVIRNIYTYSETQRTAIFSGINLDLACAKKRCEHVFDNCVQPLENNGGTVRSPYMYCRKCPPVQHYRAVLSQDKKTCLCIIATNRRVLKAAETSPEAPVAQTPARGTLLGLNQATEGFYYESADDARIKRGMC